MLKCSCGAKATHVCAQHGPCCEVRADWHTGNGHSLKKIKPKKKRPPVTPTERTTQPKPEDR